jgi:hypothetical protein
MLLMAAVVVVVFNLAAFVLVQRTVPHRLLKRLDDPTPVDGIFLGNSLIDAGFNADAFRSAWPLPHAAFTNASLGWTTPVEHDLLFRHTLQKQSKARFVVYGFFDFQLTEPPSGDWNEVEGNKVVSYLLEPEHAIELYGVTSWIDRWRFRVIRFLPMVSERDWLWNRVDQTRRVLGALGLPPVRENRFGDVEAFKAMESATAAKFKAECQSEIDRNAPLIPAVAEIIHLARAQGMQVFIIDMPMSPSHRRTFYATAEWPQYRAHVQALVEQAGGVYIQGEDWIPGEDKFMDAIHLNEAGSHEFSQHLAEVLAPRMKAK